MLFRTLWFRTVLLPLCLLLTPNTYAAISPLTASECQHMQQAGVISAHAPIRCQRLARVAVRYLDFSRHPQQGNIIVMDAVAPRVEQIFRELYQKPVAIHSLKPMRDFGADDNLSMQANNSSAFNARPITQGTSWSKHAYGLAIDINPMQNPFVTLSTEGRIAVQPMGAEREYLNRFAYRSGKAQRAGMAEEMVDIFANNGFLIWGGYWNSPIDYQHFEIGPMALVKRLAAEPDKARGVFEKYIADYLLCMQQSTLTPHDNARAHCVAQTVEHYSHWPAK